MLATAAVLLLDTILTATVSGVVKARLAELWSTPGSLAAPSPVPPPQTTWPYIGTTLPGGVGLACAFVIAAIGAARGWRWLRFAILIVAPVMAGCSGLGILAFVFSGSDSLVTGVQVNAARDVVPLWIQIAWVADGMFYLYFVVSAAVLVCLPSTATHFRHRREPPVTDA